MTNDITPQDMEVFNTEAKEKMMAGIEMLEMMAHSWHQEHQEDMPTTVAIATTDGITMAVFPEGLPYEKDEKYAQMFQLGVKIADENLMLLALCFASEVWRSKQDINGERVEPRLAPDREEALMIVGLTLNRTTHGVTFDLVKHPDQPTLLINRSDFPDLQSDLLNEIIKGYAFKAMKNEQASKSAFN